MIFSGSAVHFWAPKKSRFSKGANSLQRQNTNKSIAIFKATPNNLILGDKLDFFVDKLHAA